MELVNKFYPHTKTNYCLWLPPCRPKSNAGINTKNHWELYQELISSKGSMGCPFLSIHRSWTHPYRQQPSRICEIPYQRCPWDQKSKRSQEKKNILVIPNLACRYPIDTKEGTWKPYSRRLETGHVVPTLRSIFRELFVKQLKVREEKKSPDFLRALRPSSVVGGQTPSLKGSGRSVRPIQHTPGSCDGGLCVSQCPIIPQAPRAAFCIKGSAGGTRHQTQGPHQKIPVLVLVLHQSNVTQRCELTSSLHQGGQRTKLSK